MSRPKINDLRKLRLDELKKLDKSLHKDLMNFCSNLNEKEFPEALSITKGKCKTLYTLGKIHEKLSKKRKKEYKKQLKEAEKMILSANTIMGRGAKTLHYKASMASSPAHHLGRESTSVKSFSSKSQENARKVLEYSEQGKKLMIEGNIRKAQGDKQGARVLYSKAAQAFTSAAEFEGCKKEKITYLKQAREAYLKSGNFAKASIVSEKIQKLSAK